MARLQAMGSLPKPCGAAPTKERRGGIFGLGIGFGYDNVLDETGIPSQIVVSAQADLTMDPNTVMNFRLGYGTAASSKYGFGPVVEQDYSWRNVSVSTAVFHRLSSVGALGLGIGFDWMRYLKHTAISGAVVYYDRLGNKIEEVMPGPDVEWRRLAPSVAAIANVELVLQQGARITMQFYCKFSFPGVAYSRTPYHTINTLGATVAFMHDVFD